VVTKPGNVTKLVTVDLDSIKSPWEGFNLDAKSEKLGHV
jgi:hypothetical protein